MSHLILIKQFDNFVADNLCSLDADEFLDAKTLKRLLRHLTRC